MNDLFNKKILSKLLHSFLTKVFSNYRKLIIEIHKSYLLLTCQMSRDYCYILNNRHTQIIGKNLTTAVRLVFLVDNFIEKHTTLHFSVLYFLFEQLFSP